MWVDFLNEKRFSVSEIIRFLLISIAVALIVTYWTPIVGFCLDIMNYPPEWSVKQLGRYSITINSNKTFWDLFFGIIGSVIAFFSWKASRSSAQTADTAMKVQKLSLEGMRPIIEIKSPMSWKVRISNQGDFDAKEIRAYSKRTGDATISEIPLESNYLNKDCWNDELKSDLNLKTAFIVTYKNVASGMIYVSSAIIAPGESRSGIGSDSPINLERFQKALEYSSLSRQIFEKGFSEEELSRMIEAC